MKLKHIISCSVIFAEKNISQEIPQKHRRHFYIPENCAVRAFGFMGSFALPYSYHSHFKTAFNF